MPTSPVAITPVVLCGGSGTRLWPLSRKSYPKQFVPLIGHKSLLQPDVAERLAIISNATGSSLLCVAAEDHRFSGGRRPCRLPPARAATVLLEPAGRNTAAAMAVGGPACPCTWVMPTHLLLFCPADHHIPDAPRPLPTMHARRACPRPEAGAQ